MIDANAAAYVLLLQTFLAEDIDVATFERTYLAAFKAETNVLSEAAFRILDALFADVDAFCADPNLRDASDVDETTLRERCAAALAQLQGHG